MHKFKTISLLKGIEEGYRWSIDLITISNGSIQNWGYIKLPDKESARMRALECYRNLKEKSEIRDWMEIEKIKHILCECGCGRELEIKPYHIFEGIPKFIPGHSKSFKGKHHSEESKQKISDSRIGKYGGENHSMYGKHHSEEAKKRMSDAHIGKYSGEKCSAWKGGISFEPYCFKFNDEFKERVREFFDRKCVICGRTESGNKRKLDVHHVDYNKNTCCDNSIPLFVTLCMSCHPKTNTKRKYWEDRFKEIIYSRNINGKCFYSKEEMNE